MLRAWTNRLQRSRWGRRAVLFAIALVLAFLGRAMIRQVNIRRAVNHQPVVSLGRGITAQSIAMRVGLPGARRVAIVGRLTNRSSLDRESATVTVSVFNIDEKIIAEREFTIDSLQAGKSTNFKVKFDVPYQDVADFEVSYTINEARLQID